MSVQAVIRAFQEGLGDAGQVEKANMRYVRGKDGKQVEHWSIVVILSEGARDLFEYDKPAGKQSVEWARIIGQGARQTYANPELQEPAGI